MGLRFSYLNPFIPHRMTTAERDAEEWPSYAVIENTTLGRIQQFDGVSWVDIAEVYGTPSDEDFLVWNDTEGYYEPKSAAEVLAVLSGEAAANFAMNSKKFTGLAAGSGAGDSVRYEQLHAQSHTLASHSTKPHSALSDAPADAHADTKVRTKEVDEASIGDGKVMVYRTASGKLEYESQAGGGGSTHAPIGASYPGVLSTGLKIASFREYRGDTFSATELSIAVAVAPAGADITVKIRQNGSFIQHSGGDAVVTITDGNKQGALVLSSSITVNDKDIFDPHITATGSNPNEGSDLNWQVVP